MAHINASNDHGRIIILGAGLSGLALAQALKHHNPPIPFTVYERDTLQQTSPSSRHSEYQTDPSHHVLRSQGYRIRISPAGASALKRLLPAHLWSAFVATSAVVEDGMTRLDAVTGERGELFASTGSRPAVRPTLGNDEKFEDLVGGKSFNVDRAVVRALLLSGLKEGKEMEFGKRAEGYSIVSESGCKGVEVRFADGSAERGSFLVGADGVRSIVRRQMLPSFRLLDTEGRAVFGKTPISGDLQHGTPSCIFEGISVCKHARETRMMLFCDVMRFDHGAASEHDQGASVKVPEDYIYWVLGFRQDVLDDREKEGSLLRLSHELSAALSLKLTESWNESIRVLLRGQAREASSTLALLTAAPGFEHTFTKRSSDTAGLVTVIGDAAHPMPPVGGVGANTAWQDAYDLFSVLRSVHETSGDRGATVQVYESKMLARAKPAVERSAGGAMHLMGIKPVHELEEVDWSR